MKIAVLDGLRSPIGKYNSFYKNLPIDDLATRVLNELLYRNHNLIDDIAHLVVGIVGQPVGKANIARIIGLKTDLESVPAYSVNRNCASGMQSISNCIDHIHSQPKKVYIAGGVESMTEYPFLFNKKARDFFENLTRQKTLWGKLSCLVKFRLNLLSPKIALKLGLTDPFCNLNMGETAEILANDFHITREEQDQFSLESHQKATRAIDANVLNEKIISITNFDNNKTLNDDEGVRKNQSIEALKKLSPVFDKKHGTVTAGNSSQISDGASFLLLSSEEKAKELNYNVLGYILDSCYNALEPQRMGLGPAYSIAKILKKNDLTIDDIDLFEINEAFASQVLACIKALNDKDFCKKKLSLDDKIGLIPREKLNVYGGAIAIGHPVGMTGNRLILQTLQALKNIGKKRAIISLCIGGGQGVAFLIEKE